MTSALLPRLHRRWRSCPKGRSLKRGPLWRSFATRVTRIPGDCWLRFLGSAPAGIGRIPMVDRIHPLLEVRKLKKYFPVRKGVLGRVTAHVKAVDDVSFDIRA